MAAAEDKTAREGRPASIWQPNDDDDDDESSGFLHRDPSAESKSTPNRHAWAGTAVLLLGFLVLVAVLMARDPLPVAPAPAHVVNDDGAAPSDIRGPARLAPPAGDAGEEASPLPI